MLDVSNLATLAVATLSPYFVVGTEQFAKEVGKEAYVQTKKLKDWLWKRINNSKNKNLQQTAGLFESEPKVFGEAMEKMLAAFLESRPEIAQELFQRLQVFENTNKYQLNIQGGTVFGVAQGDNAQINQRIIQDKDQQNPG